MLLPIIFCLILSITSLIFIFLWVKTKKELLLQKQLTTEISSKATEITNAYQHLNSEKSQIQAEESKLEMALSNITDAVLVIDQNKNIRVFNKVAESLTGFTKEEAINKPIETIVRIFDKEAEIHFTEYAANSKTHLKLVGKNGKESFVDIQPGQIKADTGINLGYILTLHDVTKANQLEAMKLDFVSMAAHELRTPLTSIKGYLSVFIEENSKTLDADANQLLSRIKTASDQLMALIENLLNVSKIERGALNANFQPVDWVLTVKTAVDQLKGRAEEKKQMLIFIAPTTPIPQIEADKLRINEVLANLIANAINYTQEGGKINVSVEIKDNLVTTNIADNGIGIAPEAIPHLFTKFFRVGTNLEQGSKGTGLGLYISKSVVDMHHGKIWVTSPGLNKGSTFSFSLPLSQNT